MKDVVKFVAVAVAGYAIGFYECKYRTMKAITKVLVEHQANSEK